MLTIPRDDTGSCVSWTVRNGDVVARCPCCMSCIEVPTVGPTGQVVLECKCATCGHKTEAKLAAWPIDPPAPTSPPPIPTALTGSP